MTAILPPQQLVGADIEVPCADGRMRRYINLDYAASTPVMAAVWEAVEAFVPFYSSVHRGTGAKSRISTDAYEKARGSVARFVGAEDGSVVFVRNTTEAINVLARALPPGTKVLSTPVEHHANMLPWRDHDLRLLPFPESPEQLLADAERMLPGIDLLAVTGASNVTGEVWPLEQLAELAHAHGAELFVDAAQLAPHRAIDMAATGIDHLALSGHKLYAPFGAGALVSRTPRHRQPAAAGRRRDQARDRRRRDLGRRAGALRGRLAERDRRGRAGRRLRRARHGAPSRRRSACSARICTRAWRRSTA